MLARTRTLLVGLLLLGLGSCASLSVDRTAPNGGRFKSSALAFTFLSFDLPAPALSTARANAADTGFAELEIQREFVFPYLGRLDWLLDLICIRYARVTGTWGSESRTTEQD